jgi:hypothetical protein
MIVASLWLTSNTLSPHVCDAVSYSARIDAGLTARATEHTPIIRLCR